MSSGLMLPPLECSAAQPLEHRTSSDQLSQSKLGFSLTEHGQLVFRRSTSAHLPQNKPGFAESKFCLPAEQNRFPPCRRTCFASPQNMRAEFSLYRNWWS